VIASNNIARTISLPVIDNHAAGQDEIPMTPNEIAAALTGRPYLSFSQVSTFQACPLKWYFTYVLKAPPESVHAGMLLGSVIHAAIQAHTESQLVEQPVALDGMMEIAYLTWDREAAKAPVQYSSGDTAESLAATARQMLETWLESPDSRVQGQIVSVEDLIYAPVAADLPDLAIKMDRMHLEEDLTGKSLIITDYKTARSMWKVNTAQEHAEQLMLYGFACTDIAEQLEARLKLQFVILTKAKTPKVEAIEITPSVPRMHRSIQVVRQVFHAMQNLIVYPVPSQMNCCTCPHQRRCDRWSPENGFE